MPVDAASFVFIVTLAGVINGLGIVRWLTGFTDLLRHRTAVRIEIYWVFVLVACFQFLLHILFWWSLWDMRGNATINFLTYLYLLSGPILLYIGTSLLIPGAEANELDMRSHYYSARAGYTTVLVLLWLWALFASPLLRGEFAPTMPLFTAFLVNAAVMRATTSPAAHAATAIVNWLLFGAVVGLHRLQLAA